MKRSWLFSELNYTPMLTGKNRDLILDVEPLLDDRPALNIL